MRKLFENRYFLIIWGVVVVAFNAVLFLSVAAWKQEAFELAAFWGLYASVMLSFVAVLLIIGLAMCIKISNSGMMYR